MKDVILYLTKFKKDHLRYDSVDSIKDMKIPTEYIDTKTLKDVDEIEERWEIQTVEKDGDNDDDRQKLKLNFKLLLRKLPVKPTK